jgi:hypothetical protein
LAARGIGRADGSEGNSEGGSEGDSEGISEGDSEGISEGDSEGISEGGRPQSRRRLLKKRLSEEERALEEAKEADEEALLNGDGSPMALFLKEKAGLGGRGFERGLAALGYRDVLQLFAATIVDLPDNVPH